MNNSTLLIPLEDERSDYVIINHARWDSLLRFLWHQFSRKSFKTYMQANLGTPSRVVCNEEALQRGAFERILQA
jgi:hypothetical protein